MPVNAPHSAAKATIVGSDCVRVGGDAIVAGMEGLFCPRRGEQASVAGMGGLVGTRPAGGERWLG